MPWNSSVYSDSIMFLNDTSNTSLQVNAFGKQDSHWERIAILLSFVFLILVENGLIVLAFAIDSRLRRRSANVLIFSQAVCDLVTGFAFTPTYLITIHLQSPTANLILALFSGFILFLSLFNLLALALDRYLVLSRPFWHRSVMSVGRTVKILISIWLLPLFLTMIPLSWWFLPVNISHTASRVYHGILWAMLLILVVIMAVIYVFVSLTARKATRRHCKLSHQRARRFNIVKKELKIANLFACLLFFFVIAYFPVLYMNLCDMIGRSAWIPQGFETISLYLLMFNSVVNPLLCICLKQDYQLVIKQKLIKPLLNYYQTLRGNTTISIREKSSDQQECIPLNNRSLNSRTLSVLTDTSPVASTNSTPSPLPRTRKNANYNMNGNSQGMFFTFSNGTPHLQVVNSGPMFT